jgi:hypothetical protein
LSLVPERAHAVELAIGAADVVGYFVRRWHVDVTFGEARRHLGVEASGNGVTGPSPARPRSCSGSSRS